MRTLTDSELISAYLDGELSDIERSQFEQRLQQDDALAQQLVEFEQCDVALKQHYSAIDDKPVPDGILSMLESDETLPGETAQNVTPISSASKARHSEASEDNNVVKLSQWRTQWLPVAASFLMIALAIPLVMQSDDHSPSRLTWVLNEATSGTVSQLADNQHIHINMSFDDGQGRLCREYLLVEPSNTTHNIACYADGHWQTQVSGAVVTAKGQQYQPASGELSATVEAWLDNNMASDALSLEQEKKRLAAIHLVD